MVRTIYINLLKKLIFLLLGVVTFETAEMLGNITTIYLNDMDAYNVIRLHTDEVLKLPMKFSKIRTNTHIPVGNLVNNKKLEDLLNTTLQKVKYLYLLL